MKQSDLGKSLDSTVPTFLKDDVMEQLMERLGLTIPEYSPDLDPVRQLKQGRVPEIGTVHIPLGNQCSGSGKIYSGVRIQPYQALHIHEIRINKKKHSHSKGSAVPTIPTILRFTFS